MARSCFVLMPFAEEFDGVWQNIIRPTVRDHGDICTRADDVFAPGSIIDDIIQAIQDADYLIADLSGRNPNVFYELGQAHALAKQVILVTRDLSDIPFDLRGQRIIEYENTVAGGARLRDDLGRYLGNI